MAISSGNSGFASRLPGASDILLVIEIAERRSTTIYDREVKARVYGQSGVQGYWMVDLNDRSVSCCRDSMGGVYQRIRQYRAGESVAPEALPQCSIVVDALLAD